MILLLLDKYLEIGLLDYMVVLFLIFWRTSGLSSIVAAQFYILHSSVQGFQYLHVLASTYCLGWFFLIIAILTGVNCKLIVVWTYISLTINNIELFSYTYLPFAHLLWRNVLFLCLLLTWVISFFCCWAVGIPNRFWRLTLFQIHGLQIFSPIL